MLKIDCLLKNTEVAETVRDIIGYLGHKWVAEGKDASFDSIYRYLRDQGVEVDKETAAKIYSNELNLSDARYTSEKDLLSQTGAWREKIARALILQKSNKKMLEIGELSPSKAIAKSIADSFTSTLVSDDVTKSTLKQLEDIGRKAAMRMLGEMPEVDRSDKRTTEEIISDALEAEKLAYRDKESGVLLGLPRLWDEVRKEIQSLGADLKDSDKDETIEAWEQYVDGLESASYTLALSSKEAQTILHEALMDKGFVKETKKGNRIVDWKSLAANQNSYAQLRENVVSSLTGKGIDPAIANRVADTLHKEFREVRAKMLEINDIRQEKINETWQDAEKAVKETLPELAKRYVKEWKNYTQFEGREDVPLIFRQIEAKKIIGDALKKSDDYGMDWGADKRAIDWVSMAIDTPDISRLKDVVVDRLVADGISEADAALVAESVVDMYHDQLMKDIAENSKRILDTKQANLQRARADRKTELARLAELHDLGIFNDTHDALLARVLGIQESDKQTMDAIREYAEQMSTLRHLMAGNEFIAATRQREIAREIQKITSKAITNKSNSLKVASALSKIYQVENAALVTGYKNIIENHISGIIEYSTTKANVTTKLGKELAGNKKELWNLMKDTWSFIAGGGTEVGLAPYMVGGTQGRVMDTYNLHQMRGADWKSPKTWAKGTVSAVLTVSRAFLAATDGMFKVGNYRLHFLSAMHDALVESGNYSHEEAVKFLGEAFYGQGKVEAARQRAEVIYKKTGIDNPSRRQINILANDLLLENLILEEVITPEALKEIHESAFNMAGLGMGHESNNVMSKIIQSSKIRLQQQEQAAFSKGNYSKAAGLSVTNTAINGVIMRFAASQFNWAWIKLEQSGLGLLSGAYHFSEGKSLKARQLLEPENAIKAAEAYQKGRQSMTRGVLGIAANGLLTGVAIPLVAKAMFPDEEDPVKKMYRELGDSYYSKLIFIKTAPLWVLGDYFYHQKKGGDKAAMATAGIVENLTGLGGNKSSAVVFYEASKKIGSDKKKTRDRGWAKLGTWVGNNTPHVPFYRQGKDVLQTVDYFGNGNNPMRNYPQNFWAGVFAGAVMEDLATSVPKEEQPDWLRGWYKKKR